MSRLAQRPGAGVGITAGIRFARLFESRLSLCIRLAILTLVNTSIRMTAKVNA
jgi:hypothetical protein